MNRLAVQGLGAVEPNAMKSALAPTAAEFKAITSETSKLMWASGVIATAGLGVAVGMPKHQKLGLAAVGLGLAGAWWGVYTDAKQKLSGLGRAEPSSDATLTRNADFSNEPATITAEQKRQAAIDMLLTMHKPAVITAGIGLLGAAVAAAAGKRDVAMGFGALTLGATGFAIYQHQKGT